MAFYVDIFVRGWTKLPWLRTNTYRHSNPRSMQEVCHCGLSFMAKAYHELSLVLHWFSPIFVIDFCLVTRSIFLRRNSVVHCGYSWILVMMIVFFFPIKIKKYVFNVTGWCLAIVLAVSSLYGKYKTVREHNPHPFSPTQEIAYGILKRFAWSLAIAWVIFACQSGLGGKLTS